MTANEAIKILEVAKAECEWNAPLDYQEAFDLAISALQAQEAKHSSESSLTQKALDTISRRVAIDTLDKHLRMTDVPVSYPGIISALTEWLNELPSAHPEPQWIPVSERLPEDGENVLVTYKTTDKIHPCQYHDDGSRNPWYSYIDQCRAHMNVVLAWLPLPEPYRAERRTDE